MSLTSVGFLSLTVAISLRANSQSRDLAYSWGRMIDVSCSVNRG